MKDFLLVAHIGGALVTAVVILAGMVVLMTRSGRLYKKFAVGVGFAGGLQIVSGAFLALWSSGTVLSFCSRIGVYVAVVLFVEAAFFFAMRNYQVPFPKKLVAYPLGAGAVASVAAIAILALR